MGRVVITGIGPISALGCGKEMFVEGLKESESNIFENELFPGIETSTIEDFDVNEYLEAKKNYLDPQSAYSFGAFSSAIEDSGIDLASLDKSRVALVWATAFGGVQTMDRYMIDLHKKGPRFAKPILFPHTYGNTAISLLSIEFALSGYHQCFTSGWTSGGDAIANAYTQIANGSSDVAFVGAGESLSNPVLQNFQLQNYLVNSQSESKIYDSGSKGFIGAEGAGMLVLESLNSAQSRGASIYGEIVGTKSGRGFKSDDGESIDYKDLLNIETVSAQTCYVSPANGLSSLDRDIINAINASKMECIYSPKGIFGETFGAASVLHASAALVSMNGEVELPVSARDNLSTADEPDLKKLSDVLIHSVDPLGQSVAVHITAI